MKIHTLPSGPIETNGYLLTDAKRGEAVLIDAPGGILDEITPLLNKEGCKLTELWITHGHWDHTQDAAKVVRATGAKVLAHADDKALIETPKVMSAFLGGAIKLEPLQVDHWVQPGEHFNALGLDVEVRHVPGHCPGNVLFYFQAAGAAFVGDALFAGSVGRTDLPGGNREVLTQSILTQIYTLADETVVYAGHGEPTTVGEEKKGNPFVRG
ncbi:MAG TPA: MBL fold metallo-hydrolase [Rariglobus sp.]|jgi:glyoxylase-like metal-dependent hydrolase (beta-lactamase superfamily II)|nr:MBL fold metallo-hydrolase [Rariglobus sp.]